MEKQKCINKFVDEVAKNQLFIIENFTTNFSTFDDLDDFLTMLESQQDNPEAIWNEISESFQTKEVAKDVTHLLRINKKISNALAFEFRKMLS